MKKTSLAILIAFLSFVSYAQNISTMAGTGTAGYSGDGGPATAANLSGLNGLAIDAAGNIYVSDWGNYRIRKISTTGVITTVAGNGSPGFSGDGGPATAAKLYHTGDVFVTPAGEIYISDAGNDCIRKVNASGIISTIGGTPGFGGYSGDGGPATAARMDFPYGLAVDAAGNVFFADQQNHRVRKITPSGIITTVAGIGSPAFTGDGGPSTNAALYFPNYVCLDPAGNLYITDNGNMCIRKVNTSGIISTIAGTGGVAGSSGDGGPATLAKLRYPGGLTMDAAGNLIICDHVNNRIRIVNAAGIINTIAGTGTSGYSGDGGPAVLAQLDLPLDVVANAAGLYFVADCNNDCVRQIGTATNTPPVLVQPDPFAILLCISETSFAFPIDTILRTTDADMGQTLTWSVATAPLHGLVSGTYTTTSTGGAVTPVGFGYTPAAGYIGTDMFKMRVTDGTASDTITINVTINTIPNAGVISGIDSVCPGNSVTLSETVPGGIWSSSNISISTATGSGPTTGIVAGIAPGRDTVIYTIVNECGIASAIFPFKVRNYADCPLSVFGTSPAQQSSVGPNPSSGRIRINVFAAGDEVSQVMVSNMLGQRVAAYRIATNKSSELVLDVPSGMYIVEAITSEGRWTEKIVIQH